MADLRTGQRRRLTFQALWALLTNCYLAGFAQGRIYQGSLKSLCVPGLNCYSCPGAVASCPIGGLQAVLTSPKHGFPMYVAGFLFMTGAVFGRFVCGWLCPFGLVQDLLHKIPFPRKLRTFPGDRALRSLKYVILVVFVILLPLYVTDIIGQGTPWFCKWICPAGTLEGGWPLVAANRTLQDAIGWLYAWKNVVLISTLAASVIICRPFCRYLCPLGAVYACCNPVSLVRYNWDGGRCIHCNKCVEVCPMECDPPQNANSTECIRCGRCVSVCPTAALTSGTSLRRKGSDTRRCADCSGTKPADTGTAEKE